MNNQNNIIKEICSEQHILYESLSQGYIVRLTKGDFSRHIFGAYWDINSAVADRIACDKTACYTLLENSGIPAIKHELIFNPIHRYDYIQKDGEWSRATDFFKHYKKVVVKPNQGTKGQGIFLCQTQAEFEAAVYSVFAEHPDAALSPYHEIENEYRVFYIGGNCRFVYGKAKDRTWQHNLSQGATAFEVSDENKLTVLKTLASRAAKCIGITFATVDIAESPTGERAVMEINSGIQSKHLLEQLPHLRPVIKGVFGEAVGLMFGEAQ